MRITVTKSLLVAIPLNVGLAANRSRFPHSLRFMRPELDGHLHCDPVVAVSARADSTLVTSGRLYDLVSIRFQQFADAPNVIADSSRHCRSCAERFVNATKVVEGEPHRDIIPVVR